MKHLKQLSLALAICTAAMSTSHAQASKEVQDGHMAAFASALDTYSACLTAFANREGGNPEKGAESVADSAHAACGAEFARANDAAIIYTASTVPESGKLQAVAHAAQKMDAHKAEMHANLVKAIVAKRSGDGS